MYFTIRNGNTTNNKQALIDFISDENARKITLLASTYNDRNPNSPELIAVVEYQIPGIDREFTLIAHDNFLTATRPPRYREVEALLDNAQGNAKVYFCPVAIDQGRDLDGQEVDIVNVGSAVNLHLKNSGTIQLTKATRPDYFRLLSEFSEGRLKEVWFEKPLKN